MPSPLIDHNESSAVVFDITKPIEGIKFIGLLDHSGGAGNKLTGLFDWECRKCGTLNRDAVIVDPEQAFLSRWLCRHCEKATIVRFRARGSAEWVAEHTLAITGKALCHLAEDELAADAVATERPVRRRGSQRLFAWITVPALVALVILGLSDMRRLSDLSASSAKSQRGPHQSGALSRLPGRWVSEDGKDRLYFGHIDAVSRRGTYVHFFQNRRPGDLVWFDVIHEDPRGEKLVIRLWSEPPDVAKANLSHKTGISEPTLYLPLRGGSLTWIDIQEGKPILNVYHRVNDAPALTRSPI